MSLRYSRWRSSACIRYRRPKRYTSSCSTASHTERPRHSSHQLTSEYNQSSLSNRSDITRPRPTSPLPPVPGISSKAVHFLDHTTALSFVQFQSLWRPHLDLLRPDHCATSLHLAPFFYSSTLLLSRFRLGQRIRSERRRSSERV